MVVVVSAIFLALAPCQSFLFVQGKVTGPVICTGVVSLGFCPDVRRRVLVDNLRPWSIFQMTSMIDIILLFVGGYLCWSLPQRCMLQRKQGCQQF